MSNNCSLANVRVDDCQSDAVKRQVPSGVPGIFPLVRHRDDIRVIEVAPFVIAAGGALLGRIGAAWVAFDPTIDVVVVKLFAPQQSAQGLAHDVLAVRGRAVGNHRGVKLIRFIAPLRAKTLRTCASKAFSLPGAPSLRRKSHARSSGQARRSSDNAPRPWCRLAAGLTACLAP